MRRTYLLTFLSFTALCVVISFSVYSSTYIHMHSTHAHSQPVFPHTPIVVQNTAPSLNTYLYYILKDPKGFMLARAAKGKANQPTSKLQPITLLGNGFGLAMTDTVLSAQLSPDGRYLAVDGTRADAEQVWVYDTLHMTVGMLPANATGNFLRWLAGGNQHTFLYRPMFPMGPVLPQEKNSWRASMWLVDAATATHKNLDLGVPAAALVDAASSPDGSHFVYSTSAGLSLGSDTWMAKSDGSARTHLFKDTGLQSVNALFAWSPDGKNIAYERLADSATPFLSAGLWLMNTRNHQQQRLADTDGGHGYTPAWSPDGRKIAFIVRTNTGDPQANIRTQALQTAIGVVDVASKRTWLVASPQITGMQLNINPTWTSDGAHITFTALNAPNLLLGGTLRYWSVPVISYQVRPSAIALTSPLSHVVAVV